MGSARKLPNPKRANAPLRCDYSKAFAKELRRCLAVDLRWGCLLYTSDAADE